MVLRWDTTVRGAPLVGDDRMPGSPRVEGCYCEMRDGEGSVFLRPKRYPETTNSRYQNKKRILYAFPTLCAVITAFLRLFISGKPYFLRTIVGSTMIRLSLLFLSWVWHWTPEMWDLVYTLHTLAHTLQAPMLYPYILPSRYYILVYISGSTLQLYSTYCSMNTPTTRTRNASFRLRQQSWRHSLMLSSDALLNCSFLFYMNYFIFYRGTLKSSNHTVAHTLRYPYYIPYISGSTLQLYPTYYSMNTPPNPNPKPLILFTISVMTS